MWKCTGCWRGQHFHIRHERAGGKRVYAAGYNPQEYYNGDIRLRRVVDALADGTLKGPVASLKAYLLNGDGGCCRPPYLCLADFDSYASARSRREALYGSREWTKRA